MNAQENIADMICKRFKYLREMKHTDDVKVRIVDVNGTKVYVERDKFTGKIQRAVKIPNKDL